MLPEIDFTTFADELLKEAGLKDVAAKVPGLAKKLPEQGKKVVDKANLTMARFGTKYPKIYQEMHDPSNFAGAGEFLKKLLGG